MGTFQKHLDAITSGKITRSNIIGIRKALNAWDRKSRGYSVGQTAPRVTVGEINAAEHLIAKHHPTATGELHEGGLKVLRNRRYAKRWTPEQERIIHDAMRFDLIRFDPLANGQNWVPVYRVVSRYCESFAFRNIPWQSAWSLGEEDGPRVVPDYER
jgi:hypothetical protein